MRNRLHGFCQCTLLYHRTAADARAFIEFCSLAARALHGRSASAVNTEFDWDGPGREAPGGLVHTGAVRFRSTPMRSPSCKMRC